MSYRVDRATGEPIIYDIRPAPATYAGLLDLSGSTRSLAIAQRAPWRAALVAFAGVLVVVVSGGGESAVLGVFAGAIILGLIESYHRRDFLTPKHLVRQSGLLGGRRESILLSEIERVEVSYPRFGEGLDVGTVEGSAVAKGLTFIGVSAPQKLAEMITDARDSLITRQDPDRRSEGRRHRDSE